MGDSPRGAWAPLPALPLLSPPLFSLPVSRVCLSQGRRCRKARGTPKRHARLVASRPAELLTSAWEPAKSEAGTVAGEQGDSGLGFLLSRASQPKCRNRICLEGRSPADKHSSGNGQRGLLAAEGVGERSLWMRAGGTSPKVGFELHLDGRHELDRQREGESQGLGQVLSMK